MLYETADIFGMDVFNDAVMMERLQRKTYLALKKTIETARILIRALLRSLQTR